MTRRVFARAALVAAAFALVLAPARGARGYDGPRVTPSPLVNGRPFVVMALAGPDTAVASWDVRAWAQGLPAAVRPDRVHLEVKFGADWVSDTALVDADRVARVVSRPGQPLSGSLTLDFAALRGPGEYYVRIVAKRGGDGPAADVARRSVPVRVSYKAAGALRVEPAQAQVAQAGGHVVLTAVLPPGAGGPVDWSVDGGFGVLERLGPLSARYTPPDPPPPGRTSFRVVARLRGNPAVAGAATVASAAALGTPLPANRVRVESVAVEPAPVEGLPFWVPVEVRNLTAQPLRLVSWRLVLDGTTLLDHGQMPMPPGASQRTIEVAPRPALTGGLHRLAFELDPSNTLGETSGRADNAKSLDVTLRRARNVVSVAAFEVAPGSVPLHDRPYRLRLALRSHVAHALAGVPWRVVGQRGSGWEILRQGAAPLAAGQALAFDVEVPGTRAGAGARRQLWAVVDGANSLLETDANHQDNRRALQVTHGSGEEVVEGLDFDAVVAAGGVVRRNMRLQSGEVGEGLPPGVVVSIDDDYPADALQVAEADLPQRPRILVVYQVASQVHLFLPPAPPARATPEAFPGFSLANGWVVDRVETSRVGEQDLSGATVRWLVGPPRAGQPLLSTRLQFDSPLGGGAAAVALRVFVRGPRGADPYVPGRARP